MKRREAARESCKCLAQSSSVIFFLYLLFFSFNFFAHRKSRLTFSTKQTIIALLFNFSGNILIFFIIIL